MTFSELHESYWGTPEKERARLLRGLDGGERAAWEVIRSFDAREGFDGWWEGIEDDTRDEIFEELAEKIAAVI
jgi:hypothetical protein